ncbi:hypothetical protein [Kribbella sp. NPDC051718]|uniref:hypothetical protein n=1 Tax=Kribbella sp. NPDC051718 TaxID=3155168 RepID=UPI00342253E8
MVLHLLCPVLRTLAVVAAIGLGVGVTAVPAQAHPFGDPQTVAVSLDPARSDVVRVRWKVGGLDDLTLLGVALGVLPQSRKLLDGATFFEPADAMAIGASAEFSGYLLRQIQVSTDGLSCAGIVEAPKELARTGVDLAFTCPEPIAKADITVRTLTDLNPAYRTLATGPNGDRTVYSAGKDTHGWSLGSVTRAHAGRSAAIQLSAVAGGVVLVGAAGLVVVRRRRRQEVTA